MKIETWGIALSKRAAREDFEVRLWPGNHGWPEPPRDEWNVLQKPSLDAALAYIKREMERRIGPWEREA